METQKTTEQIRDYLSSRYDTEIVKTGAECRDEAGLYIGGPDSWIIYGTVPSTNRLGWYFVGYTEDIAKEMHESDKL